MRFVTASAASYEELSEKASSNDEEEVGMGEAREL
jgi:hypothetical protein